LKYPLRGRYSWDDWDTEETAQILTSILEDRYGAESIDTTFRVVSPDELMAFIILCEDDLPPVPDESALAERVREQLSLLRKWSNTGVSRREYEREKKKIVGLVQEAPYHAVRVAIEGTNLPEQDATVTGRRGRDLHAQMSLLELLDDASVRGSSRFGPNRPPLEPLLLLAIAVELTGVSEAQDDRIATFFLEYQPEFLFKRDLLDTLQSPFVVHQIAEKWLRRMRDRATSETLIAEIDKLLPQTSKNTKDTQDRYDPA